MGSNKTLTIDISQVPTGQETSTTYNDPDGNEKIRVSKYLQDLEIYRLEDYDQFLHKPEDGNSHFTLRKIKYRGSPLNGIKTNTVALASVTVYYWSQDTNHKRPLLLELVTWETHSKYIYYENTGKKDDNTEWKEYNNVGNRKTKLDEIKKRLESVERPTQSPQPTHPPRSSSNNTHSGGSTNGHKPTPRKPPEPTKEEPLNHYSRHTTVTTETSNEITSYSSTSTSSSLSAGAITGIIIGCLVGAALLGVALWKVAPKIKTRL